MAKAAIPVGRCSVATFEQPRGGEMTIGLGIFSKIHYGSG